MKRLRTPFQLACGQVTRTRFLSSLHQGQLRKPIFEDSDEKHTEIDSDNKINYDNLITTAKITNKHMDLEWDTNEKNKFDFFWLRENCKCSMCYSPTHQRNIDILTIPKDIKPKTVRPLENGNKIEITWDDPSSHSSVFNSSWLYQTGLKNSHKNMKTQIPPYMWNKKILTEAKHFPMLHFQDVMSSDQALHEYLHNIHEYGFAIVDSTPLTYDATKQLFDRIAPSQRSFFGDYWDFTVNEKYDITKLEQSDTAYTASHLNVHTDGTYHTMPPALQFFHFVEHAGTGGETLLLDAFWVAEEIKSKSMKIWKYLCEKPLQFHYKDDTHYFKTNLPVIKLDGKKYLQIRFNDNDRSPVYVSPDEAEEYYNVIRTLNERLRDTNNIYQTLLGPGKVLVTNNWRVMHGRTGFTGSRRHIGCYMGRDDFMSKSREMKVIDPWF